MHDALLVCIVHRPSQRLNQLGRGLGRQRLPAQLFAQTAPVDKFEREIRQAVLVADFVDLHDVRMGQARNRLSFGVEASQLLLARVPAGQEHLEGHQPVEPRLPGLVDDANATAGDGYDALDHLRAWERPDVVLLDMGLPRCDGATTAREIRRDPACAGLKVFAVSGHSPNEYDVDPGGIDRWFHKPIRKHLVSRRRFKSDSLRSPGPEHRHCGASSDGKPKLTLFPATAITASLRRYAREEPLEDSAAITRAPCTV